VLRKAKRQATFDVNILEKFYDRMLYGVEICRVVLDENSGPDTGQIPQGSVEIP
jgi:hypothetical protein